MNKILLQTVCGFSILTSGVAFANGDLTVTGTSELNNANWISQPTTIGAGSEGSYGFKQSENANTFSSKVNYKVNEPGYSYQFSINVNISGTGQSCSITGANLGKEGDPVWYEVSAEGRPNNETYECTLEVTRHDDAEDKAHSFLRSEKERDMGNAILDMGYFKNSNENLLYVLDSKKLSILRMIKTQEANTSIFESNPADIIGVADSNESIFETFSTAAQFEVNGQLYIAIGSKMSNEANSKIKIFKAQGSGSTFDLTAIVSVDTGVPHLQNIEFIPDYKNAANNMGFLAVTPKGSRREGYIRRIEFFQFKIGTDAENSTFSKITDYTNNKDKIIGYNAQEVVHYAVGEGESKEQFLVIVNKNDPAQYEVNSIICGFSYETSVAVDCSKKIQTKGAKQATSFIDTSGGRYIAFAESANEILDRDAPSVSSLIVAHENSYKQQVPVNYQNEGFAYQWLDYKIGSNDYLMLITNKTGVKDRVFSWENQQLSNYVTSGEPQTNSTEKQWEFVDMGNGYYYLLTVELLNNSSTPSVLRPYIVKFGQ